jgi:hypothetical protein
MKCINRTPLKDAMVAAGCDVEGQMTYQDYLNIVVNETSCAQVTPIKEEQWEIMVDILGRDRPMYASNVKTAIKVAPTKRKLVQ